MYSFPRPRPRFPLPTLTALSFTSAVTRPLTCSYCQQVLTDSKKTFLGKEGFEKTSKWDRRRRRHYKNRAEFWLSPGCRDVVI